MSLRRDIHSAFESIAPPLGGMPERVVQTVLADKRRRRKEGFMLRVRAPLALVAVLVVILIVVGVLVGGRLLQDWNAFRSSPAGGQHTIVLPALSDLEARPWQHAVLAAGEPCSGYEVNGKTAIAPVVSTGTSLTVTDWGEFSTGVTVFQKGFSGLLIVRLRDGRSGTNHFFLNENAGGPVMGTVIIAGQTVDARGEAVFDFSNGSIKADSLGRKAFNITEGHLKGFSTCFEWQFDGTYQGQPFVWHWYFS